MFSMKGKVCVVTGASRGLGRGIALTYAKQGADVVLACLRDHASEGGSCILVSHHNHALDHTDRRLSMSEILSISSRRDACCSEGDRRT